MAQAPSSRLPLCRRRRFRHATAGFTLVEVALAGFIMAFAIASSIVTMQWGFRSIDLARGLTLASQVLQSEIENVRLLSWEDVSNTSDPTKDHYFPVDESFEIELSATTAGVNLSGRDFRIHCVAGAITTDATTGFRRRQITLTATFKTTDGRSHTRSTTTLYCENGLNDYFATNHGSAS